MVSIGILVQDPHREPFVVKEYIIGNLIREDWLPVEVTTTTTQCALKKDLSYIDFVQSCHTLWELRWDYGLYLNLQGQRVLGAELQPTGLRFA